MNAEFNWWLLIVGVAAGAGLAWLTLSDWGRRDEDLEMDERAAEAAWIADVLRERGDAIDALETEEVLALHREYLRQAGLYDPGVQEAAGPAAGIDDAEWQTDEWAPEPTDALTEGIDQVGSIEPGGGGARPSICSGGAVAPRATPETRPIGSEPPQP